MTPLEESICIKKKKKPQYPLNTPTHTGTTALDLASYPYATPSSPLQDGPISLLFFTVMFCKELKKRLKQ